MSKVVRLLIEFLRWILTLTRPLPDMILSFFYSIFMEKTKPLPPIDNSILLMSATYLAKKIRNRQLKCEDVMRAYIARAQIVQPFINAIIDARYEEALRDARAVDCFLDRGEKTLEQIEKDTPLLGIPFTCKEVIGIKGLLQTAGLYKDKERIAVEDGDAPALYKNAGAIPVTVTNVPELCMWYDSTNIPFGKTKNPYNNWKIPGGSSGGEGALISSAGAVIGIGTDVGGSIRLPSAFNGIYGHKPSSGIVSNRGYYPWIEPEKMPFDYMNTTGPMCRYPEDIALLLKILSGNNPKLQLQKKVDFKRVKLYYIEEFPGFPAAPVLKKAVRKASKHFEEECGTKALPLKLEELRYGLDLLTSKFLETDSPPLKLLLADEKGKVNVWLEVLKSLLGMSTHTFPFIYFSVTEMRDKDKHFYDCLKQCDSLKQKFQDIFQEDAVLLLPTYPEPPPFFHCAVPKFQDVIYTSVFNITGLPSTNIPAGMSDGVPFGIQAVSGHCKDHLTIAAAQELHNLFGGWKSPCSIEVK